MWIHEGVLPGPTVEVQRDQEVRIEWHNALEGALPVVATVAPEAPDGDMPVQCLPWSERRIPASRGLRRCSPGPWFTCTAV